MTSVLVTSGPIEPGLPGARNGQPFERRVVADVVRRFAVRDLPEDLALVQIDRADARVRRLEQRQSLHGRARRRPRLPRAAGAAAPGASPRAAAAGAPIPIRPCGARR